ncbi:MAG: helix-turn-helix domain-containing protein [Oscillospiraceae bacterium]|nr:helix-turn-helix domain-containing protein [Oscillospiraceae bacterium]
MANDIYQDIATRIGGVSGFAFGIVDKNGVVIASTNKEEIDENREYILDMFAEGVSPLIREGVTYGFESFEGVMDYAVYVHGDNHEAFSIAKMALVTVETLRMYQDEKYDRNSFIKNVVLENILPGDVYARAREVRMKTDSRRVALLIRIDIPVGSMVVVDAIQALFPDNQKDFIFSLSQQDLVLIKEVTPEVTQRDMEKLASAIIDVLAGEHYINSVVGIGTIISNISELATSFREAQAALEVGKVFDTERSIVSYNNLGIARLIYQLPTTLCDMFLKEVFKIGSVESLDQETLFTIQRFFENNLNVSETSRGLFVHRNTLVYRLEKIKKLTGLDLRQFDHAIVFKVALMVKKYLDVKPEIY